MAERKKKSLDSKQAMRRHSGKASKPKKTAAQEESERLEGGFFRTKTANKYAKEQAAKSGKAHMPITTDPWHLVGVDKGERRAVPTTGKVPKKRKMTLKKGMKRQRAMKEAAAAKKRKK